MPKPRGGNITSKPKGISANQKPEKMSHTKEEAIKPWFPVHTETVKQSFPKAPFFSGLKIWIRSQTANKKLRFFLKKNPTHIRVHGAWGCADYLRLQGELPFPG